MTLKIFTMRKRHDCFFGPYQQNHSRLREKIVLGAKCPKKDLLLLLLLCGNIAGEMEGEAAEEQALHCTSEVMQFAIDSNSSSLLELLYTVNGCVQKYMNTKKWKQVSLLGLWKKSQLVVYWKRGNVQCNRALICTVL
jgi:hypothetical protein